MRIEKKINIAIFHLAFIYSGGGEKLVLLEAEGLKKLGHNVHIYTCCVDKKKCFPDLIKNYEIKEFLPWAKYFLINHESFQVILSCLLAPLYVYKFIKYDVIFAANQPSLWIAYITKLLIGKKYVAYLAQPTRFLYPRKIDKVTGLYFNKKEAESTSVKLMRIFREIIKKLDNLSIKKADKVLVNGEYMTSCIEKVYKIKAISCPAGADYIEKPVSIKVKNKNPYILMTNRHVWQKRFEYGITAFSGLITKFPEYKLIISGCFTEYTEELKIEVNRLGLNPKVIFTGLLNNEKLKKLYKLASVYLYTAPEEDYGMGVVEAMGQGIPVIAWNKGGPSKIVINNETGFLIDPDDVEGFTAKTLELVENIRLREKMSKEAIKRVKDNYSWKNHYLTIEENLKNLVD